MPDVRSTVDAVYICSTIISLFSFSLILCPLVVCRKVQSLDRYIQYAQCFKVDWLKWLVYNTFSRLVNGSCESSKSKWLRGHRKLEWSKCVSYILWNIIEIEPLLRGRSKRRSFIRARRKLGATLVESSKTTSSSSSCSRGCSTIVRQNSKSKDM